MPWDSGAGESPFPGLQMAAFLLYCHMVERGRRLDGTLVSPCKGTNPIIKTPPSWPQFSSAQSCPSLCNPMDYNMSGFPVYHQLPELAQLISIESVMSANQPSHPLLSPSPPAFNLSQYQGLFQWVRWPKYWSFSFSISPSKEYSVHFFLLLVSSLNLHHLT